MHLLKRLKFKTLTIPNAGKDVEISLIHMG